jgi:outer membrane protein
MKSRRLVHGWIFVVALLTLFSQGSEAASSPPERLTLKQAVELALANHPAVREAREQVAVAQARVGVSKSNYFPQVSFNGIGKLGLSGATNGLGLVGLPASPFYRNLSDAANVNQNIYDFGRAKHSVAWARAEVEAAQHNLDAVQIHVAERASEAYLRVLSTQQAIKVNEQALRERQEVLCRAQEFYQVGLSSKLDVDLSQVGLSNTELALTKARNDQRVAWTELAAALNTPGVSEYELVEPEIELRPPTSIEAETSVALTTCPDLKVLAAEIRAQEERLEQARSSRWPALRGVFSGGYARFAQLSADNLLVGGLGLFAPLFTGGEIKSQIEVEQRNLESLRAEYQVRMLEVRSEVSRAHAEILNALDTAETSKKTSVYAAEALRLARTRYQAQLVSFIDLLTAEAAAESARADYARALYDFEIAKARLNATMGLQP